jgi:outer membrane lipoprotein LolB
MSVRIAAGGGQGERAVTLLFDLRGQPEAGAIEFSTPLGNIVAQARWSPSEVMLTTPQGEQAFADLDSLSRETLGEVLPLAALFDWLQGRPWPAAASNTAVGGQAFDQLGWRVDVSELGQARLGAQRALAPAVQVRVLLDRPPQP